ncbi:MAG: glycerol-3-phosphate acyltransferase [Ardenticatenaceae bacterium]
MIAPCLLAALIAYLVGSFPTGVLIGRLYGVDPRMVASGRTGGTNVYRAAGPFAGMITGVFDLIKGIMALLLVSHFISALPLALVVAGLAVVIGHNCSVCIGFRGGAGTMTNSGVVLFIFWPAFLVLGLLTVLTLRVTRMASIASMVFALGVPMAFMIAGSQEYISWTFLLYGLGQAIIIFWSLRPNIKRLLVGNERIIGSQRMDRKPVRQIGI